MAIGYAKLVHAVGDAVVVCDAAGVVTLWNPAAARMVGYGETEALGQPLDLIIPERPGKRRRDGYHETMRTGVTRYGGALLRVPATHKDERAMSIPFTVALQMSGGAAPCAAVAVIRDETQRWNEERALKKRVSDLEAQAG